MSEAQVKRSRVEAMAFRGIEGGEWMKYERDDAESQGKN
jgi:hypothetical protein